MAKGMNAKLELYDYDVYDMDFVQSTFSNITGDPGTQTDAVRFICGAGKVISSEDNTHGVFAGKNAVFCGFTANNISKTVDVPISCIAPIDSTLDGISLQAGLLLPFIAAFNAAKVALGENILVVCDLKYTDMVTCLLDLLGCVAFVCDKEITLKSEDFYKYVLSETSGYGVDAVVVFYDENKFNHIIPKNICSNRSRIIYADGIGVGYNDPAFMLAEKPYPTGYTGRTPKENLLFSLSLIERSKTLQSVCKLLLKYPENLTKETGFTESGCEISPCNLTSGQLELKNTIKDRYDACLIQMSVRNSLVTEESIITYENIAINILGVTPASKHDIVSAGMTSRTVVFCDGSVAVINIISGYKEDIKIETHWDGKTAVLENNKVVKFI